MTDIVRMLETALELQHGGPPRSIINRQRDSPPKVRKVKMWDNISILHQLVSPFGKTDTASVLHEAIEYIKFLHGQVNVLSTPYMKNGAPITQQHISDKPSKGSPEDLRSRGLCLVPISTAFQVMEETTVMNSIKKL